MSLEQTIEDIHGKPHHDCDSPLMDEFNIHPETVYLKPFFDNVDAEIVAANIAAWNEIKGPRVGDFIRMRDGRLQRFSHAWDDGIQTSDGGSFYFFGIGVSFSGGLNPSIPYETIVQSEGPHQGRFWMFHHGHSQAHNGVSFTMPCRFYVETAGEE